MSAGVKTKALAAFVQQCLDPLPDAVLIDTTISSCVRRAAYLGARLMLSPAWQERKRLTGKRKAFTRCTS
ncbi:MAG: hypothetical protein E5Y56_30100 [Mesorhizobium sp.]|nr:MAG: hypothetical protein E5Y56_30100 [Mesorhizobium sp.]